MSRSLWHLRRMPFAVAMFVGAAGVSGWCGQFAGTDLARYYPAYFQPDSPPRLMIFPPNGRSLMVGLPVGISNGMGVIAFSPDGNALYGQKAEPRNRTMGIDKIDFWPAHESEVRGSAGIGQVRCVAPSQASLSIFVSAWNWNDATGGIFEIYLDTGARRLLPVDEPSACGGEGGLLSPDGKRVVRASGKEARLIELRTGADRVIKGGGADTAWTWSPDGQWIAGIRNREIVLINSDDTSRPRNLGASGDGGVQWSPDSKYLLLRKSQLSCLPTLYGESLEVVSVETGKREPVTGSHCRISGGTFGWLDRDVTQ